MHKSLILFILLFGYISFSYLCGCSSGKDDKYEKISKSDKENINEICTCLEIVLPYREKIKNAKIANDSLTVLMYEDSLKKKSETFGKCIKDLSNQDGIPTGRTSGKEYLRLLSEYVNEKHPKCAPYILGTDSNYFKEK